MGRNRRGGNKSSQLGKNHSQVGTVDSKLGFCLRLGEAVVVEGGKCKRRKEPFCDGCVYYNLLIF